VEACPVDGCIDLRARDETRELRVGAVVVSTGFKLFPADLKPQYGYGVYKNVITGMQMDRLLAPTRPFNTILRPGDGKVPERIAYILCTGSRDEQVGNPLCSRFCCMYSIKQNQLLMGALPLADITVHYMDIRAPGKRYDEFYEQAKAMGANYIKGRVADVTETPSGDLVLKYEDIENGGAITQAEYDLVVLAVGVQPNHDAEQLFNVGELATDPWQWVDEPEEDVNPGATSIPGRAPRTSRTRSCTPGPPPPRWRRTSSGRGPRFRRSEWCRHERPERAGRPAGSSRARWSRAGERAHFRRA
jgi:heterodisulfide reductase subunit A